MSECWTITTADTDPSTTRVMLTGIQPGINPSRIGWWWFATRIDAGIE